MGWYASSMPIKELDDEDLFFFLAPAAASLQMTRTPPNFLHPSSKSRKTNIPVATMKGTSDSLTTLSQMKDCRCASFVWIYNAAKLQATPKLEMIQVDGKSWRERESDRPQPLVLSIFLSPRVKENKTKQNKTKQNKSTKMTGISTTRNERCDAIKSHRWNGSEKKETKGRQSCSL